MTAASSPTERLTFACPHCAGPLHVLQEPDPGVACEAGHRLRVEELVLEQTRASAAAVWRAVRALEERAQGNRRVLSDPELYGLQDADRLRAEAEMDEDTAKSLRRYAEALDGSLQAHTR